MNKNYLVIFDPGPKWDEKKSFHDQKGWNHHTKFTDKLFLQGKIQMGGPLMDESRIFIAAFAKSESEIRNIFKEDPFIKNGVLTLEHVLEWNLQHNPEHPDETK